MESGEVVLLRSVYNGRVRWTFPHRVVATAPRPRPAQAPAVVRDGRVDVTDQALDVWVEPDGTWSSDPSWPVPELPADWDVV